MTRKPTTLHEHFRADPRGASSYTQRIEDRIWELLQRPARLELFDDGKWKQDPYCGEYSTAAELLYDVRNGLNSVYKWRAILLDGTIIREWPAETS